MLFSQMHENKNLLSDTKGQGQKYGGSRGISDPAGTLTDPAAPTRDPADL